MKTLVVFGGSKIEEGKESEIKNFLDELLPEVKQEVSSVLYGGGDAGVMGLVKDRCDRHGLDLQGFSMNIYKKDTDPEGTIYFDDDENRIKSFYYHGDYFLGLPGGVGSITEIFNVGNFIRAYEGNKQIFIPEIFTAFYELLETLERTGMLADVDKDIFHSISNAQELIERIRV